MSNMRGRLPPPSKGYILLNTSWPRCSIAPQNRNCYKIDPIGAGHCVAIGPPWVSSAVGYLNLRGCTTSSTMRLIHTKSLELSEFFGENIPSWAILSHIWEAE